MPGGRGLRSSSTTSESLIGRVVTVPCPAFSSALQWATPPAPPSEEPTASLR